MEEHMVRRIHVERAGSVNSADLQGGGDPRGREGIQLQRLTSALYQPEIGLSHGLGDGDFSFSVMNWTSARLR